MRQEDGGRGARAKEGESVKQEEEKEDGAKLHHAQARLTGGGDVLFF